MLTHKKICIEKVALFIYEKKNQVSREELSGKMLEWKYERSNTINPEGGPSRMFS